MYKIIRMYFRDDVPNITIKKNLTLEEAQLHCKDPETSSKSCKSYSGKKRTKMFGPWFDGYEEQ